jgi:LPLT family lysophospholipid transporter-like MFS transporter
MRAHCGDTPNMPSPSATLAVENAPSIPHAAPAAMTHANATRNYPLLLGSLSLSALADNALLSVLIGPLTFLRAQGQITEQQVNSTNAIYSALFFIPFLVLAPVAGYLNDRHPKTRWLLGGNLIRLAGVLLALAGVALGHNWHGAGYLLAGVGACCFSPAKYGILPEIMPAARLVKANGTVEMLTLVSILAGLGAGAKLIDQFSVTACLGIVAGVYGLSALLSLAMTRTPDNPNACLRRSLAEFGGNLRGLLHAPRLGRVLLGTGLFWFLGATVRNNLQAWGIEFLHVDGGAAVTNTQLVLLKIWLAVGVIIGSVLVGQVHRTGDVRGARWYAFAIAAFVMPMGLLHHGQTVAAAASLVLAGLAAGFYLIPLNATIQDETDHAQLGKTIAIQNFVDYSAMLVGAGFVLALAKLNCSSAQIFLALGVAIALVACILKIPAKAGITDAKRVT